MNARAGVAALAVWLACAGEGAMAAPCPLEGPIRYPMTEVVAGKGIALQTKIVMAGGADFVFSGPSAENIEAALADLEPVERDVWLLGALHRDLIGAIPLLGLYVFDHQAPRLPLYLDVLDRRGMDAHAGILRAGLAAFEPHRRTPKARYGQWSDGRGAILDPALDRRIKALGDEFVALPDVREAAVAIVEGDPSLAERYEAERAGADDVARHTYLIGRLHECLDGEDMRASLAALPRAQADIVVVDLFNLEMLNGGVHQFFNNSSGDYAPDAAAALERMDLPEHAAAIRAGMAKFPAPYPVDRQKRLAVMRGFTEAEDEALHALTYVVDDGLIFDGIRRTAEAAGLWPR